MKKPRNALQQLAQLRKDQALNPPAPDPELESEILRDIADMDALDTFGQRPIGETNLRAAARVALLPQCLFIA